MRRAQGAEGCRVVPRACEPENAAELAGFRPGRFLTGKRFAGRVKKRNKTENMFLFLEDGLSMHSFFFTRPFLPIWIGQAAAGMSGSFATFVQSWLMYELTGSKLAMGSLWLVFMLPGVLVQLVSGPCLDRWDPKRVMIAVQWSRAAIFLLPFGMLALDALEVWHLCLTTIVAGMTEQLFRPAGMAYVAGTFPGEKLARSIRSWKGPCS